MPPFETIILHSTPFIRVSNNQYNITHCDGVVIRPEEVKNLIEKLALNKACGQDQITAEHLKHALPIEFQLLAMCFSWLLMRGILPGTTMAVLLVPGGGDNNE